MTLQPLLGLMSASDERSLKDVEASIAGPAGGRFRAIQAQMAPGSSAATVDSVMPEPFTFRDLDGAHPRTAELDRGAMSPQTVPNGTRTGFLAGMAELIQASVLCTGCRGAAVYRQTARRFQMGDGRAFHDLTLKWDTLITDFEAGGRTFPQVVRGRSRDTFEGHR